MRFGETSYDHQSFFASNLGRGAKALYYKKPLLGTLAVAPMIFSEAFVPSARQLFWKPQRFPIADAHYAMGFAFLSQTLGDEQFYLRARSFSQRSKREPLPRLCALLLGISIQLGNQTGYDARRNSAYNDRAIRV